MKQSTHNQHCYSHGQLQAVSKQAGGQRGNSRTPHRKGRSSLILLCTATCTTAQQATTQSPGSRQVRAGGENSSHSMGTQTREVFRSIYAGSSNWLGLASQHDHWTGPWISSSTPLSQSWPHLWNGDGICEVVRMNTKKCMWSSLNGSCSHDTHLLQNKWVALGGQAIRVSARWHSQDTLPQQN